MSEDRGFDQETVVGDQSGLDALLRAREDACRALERGDVEIEYRGWWIDVEDNEYGWEYVFKGDRRSEPLEQIFEEIDSELAKIIRRGMQTKPTNPVDIDFSAIHKRLEDKELDRLLKELER